MDVKSKIKTLLPYGPGFLFVDNIESLTEDQVIGTYRYKDNEPFYADHFPGNPITPGVILIETMAQIGLLCLGMYLSKAYEKAEPPKFVFTSSEVAFLKPVLPGTNVRVISNRKYFRLGKLKCEISMQEISSGVKVCTGVLAGILIKET